MQTVSARPPRMRGLFYCPKRFLRLFYMIKPSGACASCRREGRTSVILYSFMLSKLSIVPNIQTQRDVIEYRCRIAVQEYSRNSFTA